MTPSTSISAHQRRQLQALNDEHRDTLEALNHAQVNVNRTKADVDRALKLLDGEYHRKCRAILANGHALDE